jgi:polyhydroxybutyrate depolymerase
MIPGTADRLMPYEGGGVAVGLRDRGTVVSSDRTLDYWGAAMGCSGAPRVERFDPVPDETSVHIARFERCRGGAIVQRWAVVGGGHTWPGRTVAGRGLRGLIAGAAATEFSATQVILDFFDAAGRTR